LAPCRAINDRSAGHLWVDSLDGLFSLAFEPVDVLQ
jgi:hypothetical protein